jgi:hypothetical protein
VTPRIGAYVLTGDATWLASSLSRYYELLDDLVVLVPTDGIGWTGRPLPVDDCLAAVRSVDVASKARLVTDRWIDVASPARAETAQRQRGVDELSEMDWILQIDNDELMPDPARLLEVLSRATELGLEAVEWPMRVLYRHIRSSRYLQVVSPTGNPRFEYPGPVAVRATTTFTECRRTDSDFLRPVVMRDKESTQINREPERGEHRMELIEDADAIVHNSWGRGPRSVWHKVHSTAHAEGLRSTLYYGLVWLPAPLTWRLLRNFHPLLRGLWPRLRPYVLDDELLLPSDSVDR